MYILHISSQQIQLGILASLLYLSRANKYSQGARSLDPTALQLAQDTCESHFLLSGSSFQLPGVASGILGILQACAVRQTKSSLEVLGSFFCTSMSKSSWNLQCSNIMF